MKDISFLNLLKKSFKQMFKTKTKLLILCFAIAAVSSLLSIPDYVDTIKTGESNRIISSIGMASENIANEADDAIRQDESSYQNNVSEDTATQDDVAYQQTASDNETWADVGAFLIVLGMGALIIMAACIVGVIINYYACYYGYETAFETAPEGKTTLGRIINTNIIVGFKIFFGLICLVVPGIIYAVKYAPLNYVLCKYPNLKTEEVIDKCKEISKDSKLLIFGYTALLGLVVGFVSEPFNWVLETLLATAMSYAAIPPVVIMSTIVIAISSIITILFKLNLFRAIDERKSKDNILADQPQA